MLKAFVTDVEDKQVNAHLIAPNNDDKKRFKLYTERYACKSTLTAYALHTKNKANWS
ncbi:hypothetical protein P3TCK_04266 [Photobacterium profundum 3TCK]|uniref:Uncharacterized protein n=1 Tax=Photobacterium profundum 3TCK TaxID=314280 RepID=Q1ZAD2_9GAMM|nr:hypothetical protein P3TCK_04266 [Photobacterium profundum 3TCK]